MPGEDGQGYNDERQQQANPYVQESQEAVESSSKASYALSSAQKGDVWGTEAGPYELGHSSGNMFSDVSDVLSKENDLIAEFEAKMKQAIESIKATEADNERSFQTVNHALEGVAGSDQARALASSLQSAGFLTRDPVPQDPSASGSSAPGGETEGTRNAQTQGQQTEV